MKVERFVEIMNADFFAGVPDSQLKALCDYLMDRYGTDPCHHIIGANEGNCTALAAGYHLATGKTAVVYMQNSGEGNIINPLASLLDRHVYGIPAIFVIGWRGEPGVHDEPQHVYQGMVTLKLMEDMDVPAYVVVPDTSEEALEDVMKKFQACLQKGQSVAFVIKRGALSFDKKLSYENENQLLREEAIHLIIQASGTDPVVSTTGKASRELFEARAARGEGHGCDFLTVGSMGHSSSIALGIAVQKPHTRVWCIDGDGAVLMHMGSLAVTAGVSPANLVHVVINNGAHETVGGMPTAAGKLCLADVARACGYPYAVCVETVEELTKELEAAKKRACLSMIEVKCALGARENLGRPTTTAVENKEAFMRTLKF